MAFADTQSTNDYYPFGSQLPGRGFDVGSYKFGFNGKENDDEVYGDGNFQDYGMRYYDTRVGRFMSVDPLTAKYPWYSPYQFAGNNPIKFIDLDGAEQWDISLTINRGKPVLEITDIREGGFLGIPVSLRAVVTFQGEEYTFMPINEHGEAVRISRGDDQITDEYRKAVMSCYNQVLAFAERKGVGYDSDKQAANMVFLENAEQIAIWVIIGGESLRLSKNGTMQKPVNEPKAPKIGGRVFKQTAKDAEVEFYSTKVGNDVIEFGGNFSNSNGTLTIRNFDIDGASTNKLGISGIKEIITDFGKQKGVSQVVIEGAKRTTGANPGRMPTKLTFKIE